MARKPEIGNVRLYPKRPPLKASNKKGYVLQFYCPIQQKRVRRSCGTRNRREARRIQRECRQRLLNGKYIESDGAITEEQEKAQAKVRAVLAQPEETPSKSWQECYDRYREHLPNRVRGKSLGHALSRIGMAERILEGARQDQGLPEGGPIAQYATLDALEYLQDRLLAGDESRFDSRAPTTVDSVLRAVKTFLRYCQAHGWIDDVPKIPKSAATTPPCSHAMESVGICECCHTVCPEMLSVGKMERHDCMLACQHRGQEILLSGDWFCTSPFHPRGESNVQSDTTRAFAQGARSIQLDAGYD